MALELTKHNIEYWSQRYQYPGTETVREIQQWFAVHRYLDRDMFLKLALWKSTRPKKHFESPINSDERIRMVTTLALASDDEYFKIHVLQLMSGVSWPVASTILHFAEPDKYIIMDFRTIWSLGWEHPKQYTFDFWEQYLQETRSLAEKYHVSLRTLDKALWQYSKEHQTK
ncbi:MAG TPA: hypothetical protein VFB12_26340 [Ktedonobacteraceae bacterium]|nr:hypothetical protein [Ktedonobacteraceae bacterium]